VDKVLGEVLTLLFQLPPILVKVAKVAVVGLDLAALTLVALVAQVLLF
jgi:hypothetical protein